MSIYEKLLAVQTELKAPKGQYNSFGKYKYRSCEDILEALKPILARHKATVFLTDELVMVGDRYYVRATAYFVDIEKGEKIETTAYAREEDQKKGMDGSQVTGASSSYARKYALNGMFDIDDNKDSDATNKGEDKEPEKAQPKKNPELTYREKVIITAQERGIDINELARDYNLKPETTENRYAEVLRDLEGR